MKKVQITFMAVIALLFTGLAGSAQNINIPNRTGPMGLQVNTFTGNLFFDRTDFVIPGSELDIDISFSYNSYNFNITRGYGNGWGFEFDMSYAVDSINNVTITWGGGREDTYTSLGGGDFKSPTGFFDILKEYETGKYLLTKPSGIKYRFENAAIRRLTKIETPNGHFLTINHADTMITSIVNQFGQTISFAYDTKGQLKSITDAITSPTRTWTYSYNAVGNLVEVKDPLGASDKYTYLTNGPIQTVSDKNLNVVDLVYYSDFSLREMVGCNKNISISYDSAQNMTVVTDHIENGPNQVSKYYYEVNNGNGKLIAISSNCCGFDETMEYDEQKNKIKQTDANGNATAYTYDGRGNVLTVTDALGQATTYTYTADYNNISSVKDPKGNVTQLEYDSKGNLTKITNPDNSTYTAAYDATGNMISSTDARGKTLNYTYDANWKLNAITGPDGLNVSFSTSPRGDLLNVTDEKGQASNLQYDILGRLTQLTDPLNNHKNFSYDAMGNMTVSKNKNDETINYSYDASNRIRKISASEGANVTVGYDGMDNVTAITNANGATTRFQYNSRNLLSSVTDAEGNATTFNYDAAGNLITKNLPLLQTLTYTYDEVNSIKEISDNTGSLGSLKYDANGNIKEFTDANGATTTLEYDNLNRITKVTNALGNSAQISYNANSQVETTTDESGNTQTLTYDDLGRVLTFTDQNGGVTTIGYDAADNITSLKDANNNTTSYTYDALNRVIRSTFPDGKYTENTYDLKNNIISFREKNGSTILTTYDSLNRLVTKTLPGGQVFTYGYDKVGKVISATNNSGTVEFTYDLLGRVTSETFNGRKVTYSYDMFGRTQKTLYPDSTEVTKAFDERNRLVSIRENGVDVVSYQYNNANQVISKTFANGVTTGIQYDIAGRMTNMNTGSFQNLSYTYDQKGNVTSIIRGDSNYSEFFTYDDNNRLISYKRGKSGGPFTINDSYTYDALGNRTAASIGGKAISYTTNSLNQMLSLNDGTLTKNFTYDLAGNLTFDGKYFKTYDLERRLLKDSASPSEVISYQYDAFGRKTSKAINGVIFHYTYSGLDLIEERDAGDVLKNRTLFAGFRQPVRNEKEGVPYYYHLNQLGSVEMLTGVAGNVAEQYRYDVYGKQSIFDEAGNALPGSITGNRFGFTGQVYDSATGHNQFFYRSYNPETGLFDQQDLIGYGDGMGMYQYVGNNPANGVDVLGLDDCYKTKSSTTTLADNLIIQGNNIVGSVVTAIGVFSAKVGLKSAPLGVIGATAETVDFINGYSGRNSLENIGAAGSLGNTLLGAGQVYTAV